MIKDGDLSVLNQLIDTLEEAFVMLERAYEAEDVENFLNIKRSILRIQTEIRGILA